jgi:ABC-type polar amino acid transport system ATPase subunit
MGASGSGKTTVLRALAGLESFERGTIGVEGISVDAGPLRTRALGELRRKVGMVFQFHCLFDHLSVLHNVTLAPIHVHRVARPDAERLAIDLLRTLGVEHRAAAFPRELSGGEAQRVAIARALAMDPPVLLMDEPTASLDAERRLDLAELLQSLSGRGRTILIATHDDDFARTAARRVIRLEHGRVEEGSSEA